ncbi:BA75_01780T0 [Komagataella pastoris]|uniref:BA75_01780T0 n=1 Tax=Komagataella pastoris TaxID=4922 RepID=A0A1B2J783_PICPA|nr:BA75_01780T0 [Komagataella pastoris]
MVSLTEKRPRRAPNKEDDPYLENLDRKKVKLSFQPGYESDSLDEEERDDDVKLMNEEALELIGKTDEDGEVNVLSDTEIQNTNSLHDDNEVKITSFNLDDELKEGVFDQNGNFIANDSNSDDSDEEEEIYDDKVIEKARKQQQTRLMKKKLLAEQKRQERKEINLEKVLTDLIHHLEISETPMEALQRLGKLKNKEAITQTVDLCSLLGKKGYDGYNMSREELMRLYAQLTGQQLRVKRTLEDAINEDADGAYEFQYVGYDEVYGPYSREEILDWRESYFKDKEVLVREIGGEFQSIQELK